MLTTPLVILTTPPFSSEQDRPVVHVFDSRGENKEMAVLDKLHSAKIVFMEVRPRGRGRREGGRERERGGRCVI